MSYQFDAQYAEMADVWAQSPIHRRDDRRVLAVLPPNAYVLDFGCNTGRFIESGMQERPDCTFFGYDINKTALSVAMSRNSDGFFFDKLSGVPDGRLDVVVFNHVLAHIQPEHLDESLFQVRRVLKKSGIVVVVTFNPAYDWTRPLAYLFGYRNDQSIARRLNKKELVKFMGRALFKEHYTVVYGDGPLFAKSRIMYVGGK